jgi:hypothetical protein
MTQIALRNLRIKEIAIQRIRSACAALVDENEVTVLSDLRKVLSDVWSLFGRRRTRTAGYIEKWIKRFVFAGCGKDDDLQCDLSSGHKLGVLKDRVRSAQGLFLFSFFRPRNFARL